MLSPSKVEIIVVGSCNTDLVTYTPRLPVPGETLHGHRFQKGFGGKGANQCVAAAKLGAVTTIVAKVGEDNDGKGFINNFHSLNIHTEQVTQTTKSATGVASILVADDGNNAIVIASGANLDLSIQDVENAKGLFQHAKVVLCQLEIPYCTTLHALKLGKSCDATTILNPAPSPEHDLPIDYYECSDIICPNETEAFSLTGITCDSIENAKTAAIMLVKKGTRIGIVTLGDRGCVYAEKKTMKAIHIKPPPVKAIDTTGAGDAFAGALAFFFVKFPTISLQEKIYRACCIASISVCHEGTQKSYPVSKDVPSNFFSTNKILSS